MKMIYKEEMHEAQESKPRTTTAPLASAAYRDSEGTPDKREYYKSLAVLQKGLVLGVMGLEIVMLTQLLSLTVIPRLLQLSLLAFAISIPLCGMGGVYRTIQAMTGESFAKGLFRTSETIGITVGIAGLVAVFYHLYPLAGMVFAGLSLVCTILTYVMFAKFRPTARA